jgi:tubulin--tyrosine ligase
VNDPSPKWRKGGLASATRYAMTETAEFRQRTALVLYPASQAYVLDSLKTAFAAKLPKWRIASSRNDLAAKPDLQWSDYDEIDWDWVMDENTLVNSYAIRKA